MTDTLHSDVIIVGAGPAGTCAALCLAQAGVHVILLDKAEKRSEKVCGGGLLRGSLRQLGRLGLLDQVVTPATSAPCGARISSPDGALATLAFPAPIPEDPGFVRIVRRSHLDDVLLKAACAAGADYRAGSRATVLRIEDERAVVSVIRAGDEQHLQASLVIAADGAQGLFNNSLGVRSGQTCLSVRAYVACDDQYPELTDFHFFARCLPLYCWVFPVEPGLCNVGLALPPGRDAHLAQALRDAVAHEPHLYERLRHAEIIDIKGGVLRSGYHRSAVARDRLLLAGDAAALVSPLTGEGIKQALLSGEYAAETALRALQAARFSAADLRAYPARLDAALARRNRQLKLLNRLISSPWVMNRMVRRLQNDPTTQQLLKRTLANPNTWDVRSLATLVSRIIAAPAR